MAETHTHADGTVHAGPAHDDAFEAHAAMQSGPITQDHVNLIANKDSTTKKRMITASFTGRELLEGTVFDTTSEAVAKEAKIFEAKRRYGPLTVIIGEKELLPIIEKELDALKVGESKTVALTPAQAFGNRNPQMVRVVPLKVFHDQKINPVPGLIITVGRAAGRVQSISGGRVRVDFNHPLAGRDISYEIKVESEITKPADIAEELFKKYYSFVPGATKEITSDKLVIELPEQTLTNLAKVNEAVAALGKKLGVTVTFKAIKAMAQKVTPVVSTQKVIDTVAQEVPKKAATATSAPQEKEKSLASTFKEIVAEKKTAPKGHFDTTSDSATTIQRPKKK